MATDSTAVHSGGTRVFPRGSVRGAELIDREQTERNRQEWQTFIDGRLVEWGRDPSALEDEGLVPPSPEVINLACRTAMAFRDEGVVPPTWVVPDGNGGIVFERVEGKFSLSLSIYADLSRELLVFDDCRLSARYHLL